MAESRYAFSLTTFSPSGKLLQIEHALTAVSTGVTAIGIKGILLLYCYCTAIVLLLYCYCTVLLLKYTAHLNTTQAIMPLLKAWT